MKNTKNILWKTMRPKFKKRLFVVFPKKNKFFTPKPTFPRKKVGFSAQSHSSAGTQLVFTLKPFVSSKQLAFRRRTTFFPGKTDFGRIVYGNMLLLGFGVFPKTVGFPVPTNLLPSKSWIFGAKPTLSDENIGVSLHAQVFLSQRISLANKVPVSLLWDSIPLSVHTLQYTG